MAIHAPINDTLWGTNFIIKNGENADTINLNRAVSGIREDVKDIYYKLYGGTPTIPNASPAEPENAIADKIIDGGSF